MSNGLTFEILTVNSRTLLNISKVILIIEEVIPALKVISASTNCSVDKLILFTLLVAEMTFKVVVMASSVTGDDNFCSGQDHFLKVDIILLATEITFKVAVITLSVAKITLQWLRYFFFNS